jgi:hemolysin D
VVRAIHVRDGSVKARQVLIELDPTMTEAERNHLRSDLVSAQLDVARLRAALSGSADPVAEFHPPAATPPGMVATQRQFPSGLKRLVAEAQHRPGCRANEWYVNRT